MQPDSAALVARRRDAPTLESFGFLAWLCSAKFLPTGPARRDGFRWCATRPTFAGGGAASQRADDRDDVDRRTYAAAAGRAARRALSAQRDLRARQDDRPRSLRAAAVFPSAPGYRGRARRGRRLRGDGGRPAAQQLRSA